MRPTWRATSVEPLLRRAASARRLTSRLAHRDRGFTLIELLVVLTLLALASAVVLPRFMSTAGPSARSQAAGVASVLRDARQKAIATAQPVVVPIDPSLITARGLDGGSLREILFFPDGSSSGGRLTVELRQRQAVVDVDDLTGAVRLRGD